MDLESGIKLHDAAQEPCHGGTKVEQVGFFYGVFKSDRYRHGLDKAKAATQR